MTDEVWATRRTSFGSRSDAYAVGRPSYPADAVRWVLPDDALRVLDLAAGTGRLTERLLDLGYDVVAVEPSAEMRAHVPTGATTLPGTAEEIPLEDRSVDAVVVGQAFHWFDVASAMAEIRRVLRPGGTLGLLWNLIDDADPLAGELCDLLDADERASSIDPDQPPPYGDIGEMPPPRRRLFRFSEAYDSERLVAFVHSRSQTILLPDAEREALIASVRAIAPRTTFSLPIVCEAWRGARR